MDALRDTMNQWIEEANVREELNRMMKEDFSDPRVLAFIEENREGLTKEGILRSHANVHEYLVQAEKFEKGEPGLVPGYYPELILTKGAIEVSYRPTEETLKADQRNQIKSRIKTYKMPKNIADISLRDVDRTPERVEILKAIFQFVQDYKENPKAYHKGLYLSGAFGVGKTYMMGAMAHDLAELGHEVQLVHVPQFVVDMKQSIADQTSGELMDGVKNTEILVLDDIGAEALSPWVRDDVLGVLLQHRMQNELSTFFTSNKSTEDLEDHLAETTAGGIEGLKAKRIMERIYFLADEYELAGPNRRNS